MSSRRASAVLLALVALAVAPAAGAPGCLAINGGAVELSWVTYCASGSKAGCGATTCCSCNARAASLATVQLVLTGAPDGGGDDGCAGTARCRFSASDQSGNTGFAVPPGDYDITVVPLDADGQVLGGPSCVPDGSDGSCWLTPAPLRRTVSAGEVVSLGSFLIVAPDCPTLPGCAAAGSCPVPTP